MNKKQYYYWANISTNQVQNVQTKMLNCWTQGNMQVTWLGFSWETEDLNAEDLKICSIQENVGAQKISWTPPVLRTQICYLSPFDFIAVGYKNMTWKGVIFFYWKFNKSRTTLKCRSPGKHCTLFVFSFHRIEILSKSVPEILISYMMFQCYMIQTLWSFWKILHFFLHMKSRNIS